MCGRSTATALTQNAKGLAASLLNTALRGKRATSSRARLLNTLMNGHGGNQWKRNEAKENTSFSFAPPPIWGDLPPDCARHAPLLTALFDGEASDTQMKKARQHLLSCERCARLWLAWHQTRALLGEQRVPAAPQELAEQLRAAIALSQTAPDLQAPILARTSRPTRVSKREGALPQSLPRFWDVRVSTSSATLWSATAVCAFVLLVARDSFLPSSSLSMPRADTTVAASFPRPAERAPAREVADDLRALPLETPASPAPLPMRTPTFALARVASPNSASEQTLLLAQREQIGLDRAPIRETASEGRELTPLSPPMALASYAPQSETRAAKRETSHLKTKLRASSRREQTASATRPIASRRVLLASARFAEAPIVLAEVAPDTSPSSEISAPSSARRGGFLLASAPLERASLRISKPRIRPLTFRRDANPNDVGLEDLDSTVQAYRATLSDDSDDGPR